MSGRDKILQNIRHSLGREKPPNDQQLAAIAERQIARRRHAAPKSPDDLLLQFKQQIQRVQMSCDELADESELPQAVLRYLKAHDLPATAVAAPELEHIAWGQELQLRFGAAQADDLSSITACSCAIAETGSIVLSASADSPATLRFLPDNHMVVLRKQQLLAKLEDAWDLLRAQPGGLSRAVHLNTGPSRTGDVEQTIEIGAHGPRRMQVFLLNV